MCLGSGWQQSLLSCVHGPASVGADASLAYQASTSLWCVYLDPHGAGRGEALASSSRQQVGRAHPERSSLPLEN